MAESFMVRTARWSDDAAALRALRHEVFVQEQHVPDSIEWDGLDPQCMHALACSAAGEVLGCGRLLPDGNVGRLAVRRPWRGRGVGSALLRHLVALAREAGHARVVLNAQTQAADFYRQFGFLPVGDEFMEAGIAHQTMERPLDTSL